MQVFEDQAKRIKNKLIEAKKADSQLKVFGASSHKYVINKPVSESEIDLFEKKFNISLPDCYKYFLKNIGNGGKSFGNSAAGPYYGIYPFQENINEFNLEDYLSHPSKLFPFMSDTYWEELIKPLEHDNNNDEDYEAEMGKIYAGILPIGTQGCSSCHGLILNGEHKGKIINYTLENYKPKFAYENNFLDWYERWLDEIISGELIVNQPSWFGYTIGGSDTTIIETYFLTDNEEVKKDCLSALLGKIKIENSTIASIEREFLIAEKNTKTLCLYILTKFDYEKAKPYLLNHVSVDLLTVFKSLFWYGKDKIADWPDILNEHIKEDAETHRFRTYLLDELNKKNVKPVQTVKKELNELKNIEELKPKKKWYEFWKN